MQPEHTPFHVLSPKKKSIGDSFVERFLPQLGRRTVGPFVFIDHFRPDLETARPVRSLDVPPHPHIGLSTLSYLFEGTILHRDSIGSKQLITPGAVNWMTAGRGIVHSERTPENLRANPPDLFGVQCWVALPVAHESDAPRFQHVPKEELPVFENDGVWFQLVAGEAKGERSPVEIASPLVCGAVTTERGGALSMPDDIPERALLLLAGGASWRAQRFEPPVMLILNEGDPYDIEFEAKSRAFFVGGPPLPEKRFLDWNFCSSRLETIQEAKDLYRQGLLGQISGEEPQLPLPEDVR